MKIKYKKDFTKTFEKLDRNIQEKTIERISIFQNNPFLKILNNHSLNWKYKWFRSINITWDYRAIFKEISNWNYEFIEFIELWTHSQLYF